MLTIFHLLLTKRQNSKSPFYVDFSAFPASTCYKVLTNNIEKLKFIIKLDDIKSVSKIKKMKVTELSNGGTKTMGMAASQSRFLGLTARKTNVEFEGQQINQQRTCLSNQSASYNNELLGLTVPTAPSVDAFTKTTYSWVGDDSTKYTISSLAPRANATESNQYVIDYQYSQVSACAYVPSSTEASKATVTLPFNNINGNMTMNNGIPVHTYTYKNQTLQQVTDPDQLATLITEYNEEHANDLPTASVSTMGFCYYTDPDTRTKTYFSNDDLESLSTIAGGYTEDPDDLDRGVTVDKWLIGQHTETKTEEGADATISRDSNGRMTNLKIGNSSFTLNTETVKDEDGYNDAVNNYEYSTAQYEKHLADINAKISVVQSQDRILELKLKQLDTEQEAISTEMESVKKVIDKNIESGFKSFA